MFNFKTRDMPSATLIVCVYSVRERFDFYITIIILFEYIWYMYIYLQTLHFTPTVTEKPHSHPYSRGRENPRNAYHGVTDELKKDGCHQSQHPESLP